MKDEATSPLAVMECRGCFYGVHHPQRTNPANGSPDLLKPRAHVICHLMPTMLKVQPDHWCGQFADRKAREYAMHGKGMAGE